jgi:LPXTG-site transpeptidase (sortase) family protein
MIPALGVDAPVSIKSVDPNGVMQAPDGAYDVAWYSFTSPPGGGGNVVVAGHVDYAGVGPAVFYSIGSLAEGDLVQVQSAEGVVYDYRVTGSEVYYAMSAPIGDIVAPTGVETVTMITCTGTFNPATGEYDQRIIVRAERVS